MHFSTKIYRYLSNVRRKFIPSSYLNYMQCHEMWTLTRPIQYISRNRGNGVVGGGGIVAIIRQTPCNRNTHSPLAETPMANKVKLQIAALEVQTLSWLWMYSCIDRTSCGCLFILQVILLEIYHHQWRVLANAMSCWSYYILSTTFFQPRFTTHNVNILLLTLPLYTCP